jgi:hypothetical protein
VEWYERTVSISPAGAMATERTLKPNFACYFGPRPVTVREIVTCLRFEAGESIFLVRTAFGFSAAAHCECSNVSVEPLEVVPQRGRLLRNWGNGYVLLRDGVPLPRKQFAGLAPRRRGRGCKKSSRGGWASTTAGSKILDLPDVADANDTLT